MGVSLANETINFKQNKCEVICYALQTLTRIFQQNETTKQLAVLIRVGE